MIATMTTGRTTVEVNILQVGPVGIRTIGGVDIFLSTIVTVKIMDERIVGKTLAVTIMDKGEYKARLRITSSG